MSFLVNTVCLLQITFKKYLSKTDDNGVLTDSLSTRGRLS